METDKVPTIEEIEAQKQEFTSKINDMRATLGELPKVIGDFKNMMEKMKPIKQVTGNLRGSKVNATLLGNGDVILKWEDVTKGPAFINTIK